MNRDRITIILEEFIWSGTSAFLISLAHCHPNLWPVSLVALVPFLWRVSIGTLASGVRLGILLAVSIFFVSCPPGILVSLIALRNAITLTALCAGFGLVASRVARHVGPNAVLLAILWLPIEYLFGGAGVFTHILSAPPQDAAAITRIAALFGTLLVSFLVVFINALVLTVVSRLVHSRPMRLLLSAEVIPRCCDVFEPHVCKRIRLSQPFRRGPPSMSRQIAC